MAFVENQGVRIYWDLAEAAYYAICDFLAARSAGIAAVRIESAARNNLSRFLVSELQGTEESSMLKQGGRWRSVGLVAR